MDADLQVRAAVVPLEVKFWNRAGAAQIESCSMPAMTWDNRVIYPLHVTYRLDYDSANEGSAALGIGGIFEDFHDQLEIVIEPSRPDDLKPEFEQFARDLDSKDVHTRLEAAKVIGYLAPRFMEPTILNMLDSPILEGYGVEGLRNLGTSSAHQAFTKICEGYPAHERRRRLPEGHSLSGRDRRSWRHFRTPKRSE